MNFTKMQGAGNDFILVETCDTECNWSKMATVICDRHFGIGADGLLLLLPSTIADFQMRIFNLDGSEADACGNGLRCLGRYLIEKGMVEVRAQQILVETMSGIRKVNLQNDDGSKIQVSMGVPKFRSKDIPIIIEAGQRGVLDIKILSDYSVTVGDRELLLNPVSVGNPHAVYFLQYSVSDFPLFELGPQIEQHKIFPQGVNFEVARVMNRQQIEARVWERGVGETLACGSGACAIAVIAQLRGYIDNKVDVKLPGGLLEVEWDRTGEVFLSGSAETVFTGEWTDMG